MTPTTRAALAAFLGVLLGFPERVGRCIMHFGFVSLISKFEEHVGLLFTQFLLWCIGIAAIATALRAAYTLILLIGWAG